MRANHYINGGKLVSQSIFFDIPHAQRNESLILFCFQNPTLSSNNLYTVRAAHLDLKVVIPCSINMKELFYFAGKAILRGLKCAFHLELLLCVLYS